MAYLFRQKLNLSELANLEIESTKILIYEPEEYLSALYAHYLKRHNFDIKHCPNLNEINSVIKLFFPDVLIFSLDSKTDSEPYKNIAILPKITREFPHLRLVSIGSGSNSTYIKELMAAGVLSHINRQFSKPQDLVTVIKSIL